MHITEDGTIATKSKYRSDNDWYKLSKPKAVECIETGLKFKSITDAAKYYNINYSTLEDILRIGDKSRTAGFNPKTGQRLHWRYLDGNSRN